MLGVQTRFESLSTFKSPPFNDASPPPPLQETAKPKAPSVFRSTKGASKHRRDLINSEISNLRDLLPFPESTRQRLSQLQIMSLSCVFIRKCNFFSRMFGTQSFNSETPFEFSQSISGFLLTATRDGKLLYISENVTEYLGHSMVDMLTQGDSLYDIIDKRDHGVIQGHLLRSQFSATPGSVSDEKAFFCRMNVSRSLRRQSGFGDHKVMHVRGHFVSPMVRDHFGNQPVFTAVCSPLITPDAKDTVTQNNTMIFRSVHGLDMKYIEMATNGEHHLGYSDEEIKGKSWYELLHPEDITDAKDKHVQLIKSSHEMGCMLTVRLMSAAGQCVWVNMVMHIRQPFPGDNGDPAIVCINHVVSEHDATGYKLQSQLYSSHIARSPEIFSSPSPQHTITQVEGGSSEQFQQSQQQQDVIPGASYGAVQMSDQQQQMTSTSSLSTDASFDVGPDEEQKHTVRADIINRLKRKMSETSPPPPCKPAKVARPPEEQSGGSEPAIGAGSLMYTGSIGVAPLTPATGAAFLESGTFSMSSGAVGEPPMYVQLPVQPQIHINPKDLLYDLQQPSPLTPSSVTSDASSSCDLLSSSSSSMLSVDVTDVAVVPASFLTPDCSPAASPNAASTLNPTLHDISALQDISFFAMEKSFSPKKLVMVEVKTEDKCPLPEIDLPSLEKYFMGNDLSWLNPDEMVAIMEQSIKKEQVQPDELVQEEEEEDLVSMCESFLEDLSPSLAVDDCLMACSSMESLPENHEQLIEELSQLSAATNASPSYGDDLESALFNSTL